MEVFFCFGRNGTRDPASERQNFCQSLFSKKNALFVLFELFSFCLFDSYEGIKKKGKIFAGPPVLVVGQSHISFDPFVLFLGAGS
jgi:hypothetical protein